MVMDEEATRREWHKIASSFLKHIRDIKSVAVFVIQDTDKRGKTIGISITTVDPEACKILAKWLKGSVANNPDTTDERTHHVDG